MTRVLIVNHDLDMADQEAESLRRRGYEAVQCWGPSHASCPVMRGLPCHAVDAADVLVYDVWSTGDSEGGRRLVEGLREEYPGTPIVLTAPGIELDWVEVEGPHAVVPLVGTPSADRLDAAVREALTQTQPAA